MHNHQHRSMPDFVGFRYLMTPSFLQPIWLAGSVFIVLFGLITSLVGGGFFEILGAFIGIAFGLVIWRVCCEVLMLLFQMHEAMLALRPEAEHELEPALVDLETGEELGEQEQPVEKAA